MFRSAVFKLTGFYFALLLFVCVVFSIQAFVIASQKISRGAQNQENILREYRGYPAPLQKEGPKAGDEFDPRGELRKQIDEQVNKDRQQLLNAILLSNFIILASGTVLCYFVAKRTLRPIELSHKAQSRFTADASHELRTPLTVMKTEIEVALKQDLSNPELKEVLESNLEEIEKLTALSAQLLSLTKVDRDDGTQQKINLSDLLINEIVSLEEKHSITIDKSIESDISIGGIESLLKNVVDTLISNALQYAGDAPATISVKLHSVDSHNAELIVRDNGIGIEKEEIDHIFERFYRGTRASQQRKNGHGLGLALVEEILKKHNASIAASSKLGEFTEFKIVFAKVRI